LPTFLNGKKLTQTRIL